MATFCISRYSLYFAFLALSFVTLTAKPIYSFALKRFDQNPNFESDIALFGDAEIVNGGSSVRITRPSTSSAGRLMCKNPIKFIEGNPRKPISFSTYFSFSISPESGDGLAFVILPGDFVRESFDGNSFGLSPGLGKSGLGKVLAVEFDTSMDAQLGDPNGNHVGIDIGSLASVRVSDVSSINLVLNSGEKLQSWIDYDASSKRMEVRLTKWGNKRPSAPMLAYQIDLSEMWKDEQVFVGISSSSANSSQISSVYSWSFKLRRVPSWLHSQPLDPRAFSVHRNPPTMNKRNVCVLRILTAVIFGTGCGALAAFFVLLAVTIFVNRNPVASAEYPVHPAEYGYKKIKVVVEKSVENGKK